MPARGTPSVFELSLFKRARNARNPYLRRGTRRGGSGGKERTYTIGLSGSQRVVPFAITDPKNLNTLLVEAADIDDLRWYIRTIHR